MSIAIGIGACFLIDALSRHLPGGDYSQRLVALAGLYVTLSVSLNIINGICGQFSIGHAAFYQVGAYTGAYLSMRFTQTAHSWGIGWLFAVAICGAIAAAIAGLIVGLPSLRLRGDYLAIVTLGFGEIIRIIVQNTNEIGGAYGMNVAPKFVLVWPVWILAFVCIAVSRNLLKTGRGLMFLSVREDEVAAQAMGVNITRVKLAAFLLGSAFAGAAGVLLAHYEGFITPTTFGMDISFIILTMVVLGGTGSITGSIIAALFLFALPELLRTLKDPRTGQSLSLSGATVVACLIALVVVVAIVKRVLDAGVGTKLLRAGKCGLAIVGGLVLVFVCSMILGKVPAMAHKQIPAEQLRMVIFALSLIVIMLLRPEGLLAHHEFSWSFVKRILGIKAPTKAVAT